MELHATHIESATTVIEYKSKSQLPTRYGDFTIHVFHDSLHREHIVLTVGTLQNTPLVRIHSECATGDIFGSMRCDCRDQMEAALQKIAASQNGILIYVRGHEGRGIGLANKIKSYALQENGMDTIKANTDLGFPSDARDYKAAVEILNFFDVKKIQLLTNNPRKIAAVEAASITVADRVPLWTARNPHNDFYMTTKQNKMGHLSDGNCG